LSKIDDMKKDKSKFDQIARFYLYSRNLISRKFKRQ